LLAKFFVPVAIESEANRREHWAARYRRSKRQRKAVALLFPFEARQWLRGYRTVEVLLVRHGSKALDSDNLAGGLKAVRDEVAKQLGEKNDASARYVWRYDQVVGVDPGVQIIITKGVA